MDSSWEIPKNLIWYKIKDDAIGIDLGTTRCRCAVSRIKGVAETVALQNAGNLITLSPSQVSAILLKHMKIKSEEFQGKKVNNVVVTIPAVFIDQQCEKTLEAANLAEFDSVTLLPEPVAAAFSYFFDREIPNNSNMLLFDLGGGTLDVCFFRIFNDKINIISKSGDLQIRGRNFDNILFHYLKQKLENEFDIDNIDKKKYKLLSKCQEIKEVLSTVNDYSYEEKEKSETWKKSSVTDLCSKYSNTLSLNGENEKCWKKNDFSNATNNSTISLHISVYENSNEGSSDSFNKNFQKSLLIQKQKQINPTSTFNAQNPFEFSRQEDSGEAEPPEVSQFVANQRLLNTNESTVAVNDQATSNDLYEFIGQHMVAKTSVVILRENKHQHLKHIAERQILNRLMEFIALTKPDAAERRSFGTMLDELTCSSIFQDISLKSGSGKLDERVKKRRSDFVKASGIKRIKGETTTRSDDDIDLISNKLLYVEDTKVLHELYEKSSSSRVKWIQGQKAERGVLSLALAKFRHLKSDLSLLQYDVTTMFLSKHEKPTSLRSAFRDIIPGIFKLAAINSVPFEHPGSDMIQSEIPAFKALCYLLKVYCKRSGIEIERIFLERKDLNYREALQFMVDQKISSPMIFSFETFNQRQFYIASDDEILKVNGHFADAIKSLLDVYIIFSLKPDSKTTGIIYFFELMMGIKTNAVSSRLQLLADLKNAASQSQQSENVNADSQSENVNA
uniref:Uncharacterized protein n=1 Tax=Panagrolaimus sp. PS1159 TaxID=55785 RepID=A0AC35G263_9BILA